MSSEGKHSSPNFWKNEWNKFCSNTSVKGVSRITKAENKCIKFLWIFSITAFSLICATSVYNVAANYLAYETVGVHIEGTLLSLSPVFSFFFFSFFFLLLFLACKNVLFPSSRTHSFFPKSDKNNENKLKINNLSFLPLL